MTFNEKTLTTMTYSIMTPYKLIVSIKTLNKMWHGMMLFSKMILNKIILSIMAPNIMITSIIILSMMIVHHSFLPKKELEKVTSLL